MTPVIHTKKAKINTQKYAVLFIHGAGGGGWYFHHYMDYLSGFGYDTYAIDLRGHGKGEMKDYTLDDYLDDVVLAARAINHAHLIMIGHSMGAAVCLKAIEKHHNLCELAILLSPPPIWGIDIKDPLGLFFDDMLGYLRQSRKENPNNHLSLNTLLSKMMFNDHLSDEDLKDVRKKLVKESPKIRQELLKPYLDDPRAIKTPMVLMGSHDDQLVHEEDLIIMAEKLSAKLIMLEDLPHFMMLDPNWRQSAERILIEIRKI